MRDIRLGGGTNNNCLIGRVILPGRGGKLISDLPLADEATQAVWDLCILWRLDDGIARRIHHQNGLIDRLRIRAPIRTRGEGRPGRINAHLRA